jgi:hypothetical protein
MNLIRLRPGEQSRIHRHLHQEEVYLVLEGTLTLMVEDEPRALGRGELARVAPDVAIVGAPFDDAVSHRPGARFGPRAIRAAQYTSGSLHSLQLGVDPFDVLRVVDAGMRCVCRMVFLHGFVHADLHPGNVRFLPPGRIVLLDLGLVGSLVDEDRLTVAELLYALSTGDGVTVARLFYVNAPHKHVPVFAAYEREFAEFVENIRARGLGNLQVTIEIGRIFDILRRHRIPARSHMTMVNLALMTAEGLGKRLAPELSLTDAAIPYLMEALGRTPVATPTATPSP